MSARLTVGRCFAAGLAILLGLAVAPAIRAGQLEEEHELSMEFVTPHTKWAKPYAGGKIRALFFCRGGWYGMGTEAREIIELMQGFDIEADAVYWGHPKGGLRGWLGGEEGHKRILRLLQGRYDVYVFLRVAPIKLSAEEQYKMLEFAAGGAGIVMVGTNDIRVFKAKNKLTENPSFLPLEQCFRVGKGRGVRLPARPRIDYDVGWQVRYDYWQQRVGRAVLWAAGREPQMTLGIELLSDHVRRWLLPLSAVSVSWSGTPSGTSLDAVLRRWDGKEWVLARRDCGAASGTLKLTIPVVCAGDYHIDVFARSKRGVETWATVPLTVKSDRNVHAVHLARDWGEIGGRIRGKVELSGAPEPGDRVIVRLMDWRGRVLERRHPRVVGSRARFSFRIGDWMPMLVRVEAAIVNDGREVASAYRYFRVTRRSRGRFNFVLWDLPVGDLGPYGIESIAKMGVTAVLAGRNPSLALAAHNIAHMPYATWLGGSFCTLGGSLDENGVMTWRVIRKKGKKASLCWNDESGVQEYVDSVVEKYRTARQHGVLAYSLGDEGAVRGSCLSPHCLKAYRRYLKKTYGSIRALNEEWGTAFRGFDQVTLSEVGQLPASNAPAWFKEFHKKRVENLKKLDKVEDALIKLADKNDEISSLQAENYPRWYDRQAFQCYNLVELCKRFDRGFKRADPKALTGFEGTNSFMIGRHPARIRQGGDIDLIVRELGWFGPYMWDPVNEVVRSIAPPDFPRGNWMGYAKDADRLVRHYWKMIIGGMNQVQWWMMENVGKYHGFLAPHLGPFEATREMLDDTQVVRDGLGTLLVKSEMLDDGIVMLYSMPSTYIVHFDGNPSYGDYRSWHEAWHNLVRQRGLQFRYVTDRMLRLGEFDPKRCKVLILPFAVAIGKKEAEVIRRFVRAGGTLIADVRPGVYDGHCKPLTHGVLDEVFGVERQGRKDARAAAVVINGPLFGKKFTTNWGAGKVDPAVKVTTGRAAGEADGVPVCIVNRFGEGHAVLLNCTLGSSQAIRLAWRLFSAAGVEPPIARRKADGGELFGVDVTRWRNGDIELLSLYGHYEGKAKVELPGERYVYDLRRRKALGRVKNFSTGLRAYRANFFALLPQASPPVSVVLPKGPARAGTVVKVFVSVPGAAGRHAVRIRVKTPSGDAADWHDKVLVVGAKPKEVPLPFAYNDPPGEWTFRAIDLFTNEATTAKLTLRP